MAGTITPRLSPGFYSIYGRPSIYGFGHSLNMTFGVIYDMGIANSGAYSVGQNVLIPYDKDIRTLTYANQTYWLVEENKIILVESEVPPLPEP